MWTTDMVLRDSEGGSITTDEEFRAALERGFDRWSAQDIVDALKEKDVEFSKSECLSYLAENYDFSDELGEFLALADEIVAALEKIKSKRAGEVLEKAIRLRNMLENVSVID